MNEATAELIADIVGDPRVAGDGAAELLGNESFMDRALRQALEPAEEPAAATPPKTE